jgi:hypothetical protein
VFRRLGQRLRETGSVTPTVHVNTDRPQTVRTPANEDVIIAAVKRQPWRNSCDIARESGPTQAKVLEALHGDKLHSYHCSRSAHLFSDDSPLGMQFCEWLRRQHTEDELFCGQTKHVLRVRVCSTSTTVTSEHGIISMLSASASAFGLNRREHCRGPLPSI